MISAEMVPELVIPSDSKILMLVIDGVGGLPHPETGKTELESARTPHLDEIARAGSCGLIDPIGAGITPGSGPSHLALFGYDPLKHNIGRGVLSALGIDFPLQDTDVATRMNFCTVDEEGRVVDRRAGRIPTDLNAELCGHLRKIGIPGVELFVEPEMDYRAVAVFRGADLSDKLTDSDPQAVGVPPKKIQATTSEAERTGEIVNTFIGQAGELLKDQRPANMILTRGYAKRPHIPQMADVYGLKSAAIATYPMYRGLARLVGMEVLATGTSMEDEVRTLEGHFEGYDFFYLHVKKTDSAGEDGDFETKIHVIEELDGLIPRIKGLNPDVLIVTGDHSTPCTLRSHSWHPLPFVLLSPWCMPDGISVFSERACAAGILGRFPTSEAMALAMANAQRLTKYGA